MRSARCQSCGYSASYTLGGTRKNYKTHDPFPILCKTCRAVTTINRAEPIPQTCTHCGGSDYTPYGENTRNEVDFSKFQVEHRIRRTKEINDLLQELKSDPVSIVKRFGMEDDGPEVVEQIILDMHEYGVPTGWDAGLHLCPVCEKHALAIDEVRMFFD